MILRICVSPHGRLLCEPATDEAGGSAGTAVTLSNGTVQQLCESFHRSSADGLLLLAEPRVTETLSADLLFWREYARRFFQAVCQLDEERLAEFVAGSGDPALGAGQVQHLPLAQASSNTRASVIKRSSPSYWLPCERRRMAARS